MARPRLLNHMHAAGLVVPLIFLHGSALMAGSDGIQRALSRWREREEKTRSLDVHLSGTGFRPKFVVPPQMVKKHGDVVPEIRFPVKIGVILDELGRERLDCAQTEWGGHEKGFYPISQTHVFDGKRQTSLFQQGEMEFPNSHIKKVERMPLGSDAQILPLMLIYRSSATAASAFFGPNVTTTTVDRSLVLKCVEPEGTQLVWVDPERDFMLTRYHDIRDGKLRWSYDIEVTKDPAGMWVPKGWTRVRMRLDGGMLESVTLKVTQLRINEPISEAVFQLSYQPGTWVRQYDTDEQYIVLKDGEKRRLTGTETDPTNYWNNLRTGSSLGWVRVFIPVALVGLALVAFWYRRTRRATGGGKGGTP